MKKLVLILIATIFAFSNANSQVRRTPGKRPSSTVKTTVTNEKKSDEQLAMEKAQVWFKDKYVETMFKDPYSYRVVGIRADSITYGEFLDKMAAIVKSKMEKCDIPAEERTQSIIERYKNVIKECEKSMEEIISSSLYDRYKNLKNKCELAIQKIELYLLQKEELNNIIETKRNTSTELLNEFYFYDIHLDCYSKNDLGNEVLGRFVFPFTKEGVYKDEETTFQMVEKVN